MFDIAERTGWLRRDPDATADGPGGNDLAVRLHQHALGTVAAGFVPGSVLDFHHRSMSGQFHAGRQARHPAANQERGWFLRTAAVWVLR